MEYLTRLKLIDQLSSINHENDALAQSLHPTEAARTSPRPVVNFYDFSRYFLHRALLLALLFTNIYKRRSIGRLLFCMAIDDYELYLSSVAGSEESLIATHIKCQHKALNRACKIRLVAGRFCCSRFSRPRANSRAFH